MSLDLELSTPSKEGYVFHLSSAYGWGLVCEWAKILPDSYSHLKELCEDGSTTNTEALCLEMRSALSLFPPGRGDVAHTVQGVVVDLIDGFPDETATITM